MTSIELKIKPTNKKQQKQYDDYIKKLDLKTDAEKFILNCVLHFDWKREKIVREIKNIRESEDGRMVSFYIMLQAPYKTTDYCTGNPYKEEGWSIKELGDRLFYTYNQMDYYTTKY